MAVAPDPVFALAKMERQWPDAIICAVDMPRMDGVSFVRGVMAVRPTPVVVCANFSQPGVPRQLLEAGATDVIPRPALDVTNFLRVHRHQLVASVRAAVKAHRQGQKPAHSRAAAPTLSKPHNIESL
jgi:two-component system chemotaxis response regulator CheB